MLFNIFTFYRLIETVCFINFSALINRFTKIVCKSV